MALVTSGQITKIKLAYPHLASVAALAQVGSLVTETLRVPVLTTVVRKYRKVILPNGQTVTIDE